MALVNWVLSNLVSVGRKSIVGHAMNVAMGDVGSELISFLNINEL